MLANKSLSTVVKALPQDTTNSLSPTVVADYETKLIQKKVLQNKINELYEQFEVEYE